jgi:hypothetical protein
MTEISTKLLLIRGYQSDLLGKFPFYGLETRDHVLKSRYWSSGQVACVAQKLGNELLTNVIHYLYFRRKLETRETSLCLVNREYFPLASTLMGSRRRAHGV